MKLGDTRGTMDHGILSSEMKFDAGDPQGYKHSPETCWWTRTESQTSPKDQLSHVKGLHSKRQKRLDRSNPST